jgi:hypothetical protein
MAKRRKFYGLNTADAILAQFEQAYEISTSEFLARYAERDPVEGIPAFHCHVWASFAADHERMSDGSGFRAEAERLLAGV